MYVILHSESIKSNFNIVKQSLNGQIDFFFGFRALSYTVIPWLSGPPSIRNHPQSEPQKSLVNLNLT